METRERDQVQIYTIASLLPPKVMFLYYLTLACTTNIVRIKVLEFDWS